MDRSIVQQFSLFFLFKFICRVSAHFLQEALCAMKSLPETQLHAPLARPDFGAPPMP